MIDDFANLLSERARVPQAFSEPPWQAQTG